MIFKCFVYNACVAIKFAMVFTFELYRDTFIPEPVSDSGYRKR